jgi:ADP-glucose type glycogen/starch synthase
MAKALNIAFVWHMHQPFYKDQLNDTYELPWVRLHGIKDYYDMAAILDQYPKIHQTFNLVPCLLKQLEEYAEGAVKDKYLHFSMKPAERLNSKEKIFILKRFCDPAWQKRLNKYPRYWELTLKREELFCTMGPPQAANHFDQQEYCDLQVWFNLSWFDPIWFERYPELKSLVEKGRDFTEEDKRTVIEKQFEAIRQIIPKYREMQEKGQIEITTSPYYHPILPLLLDSDSARIAVPDIRLPQNRFSYAEDAKAQIDLGLASYRDYFKSSPRGMWPPEQGVGENILSLLAQAGLNWIISDEEVLAKSLSQEIPRDSQRLVQKPDLLYQPYLIQRDGFKINAVFRDQVLSNLIAFVYGSRSADEAVRDFIQRLEAIWDQVKDEEKEFLVTVALDGENCWEHYENDGRDFLHLLYRQLSESEKFNCVTVSEFLAKGQEAPALPSLHTGSWINGNFRIWIGTATHSLAWDYLYETRRKLSEHQAADPRASKEMLEKAWQEIYIAEGSDWLWWFSNLQNSGMDDIWDGLFRMHLRAVYELLGEPAPLYLYYPLIEKVILSPVTSPLGRLSPRIDGRETNRDEWSLAGRYDFASSLGTLSRQEVFLQRLYYGYGENELFVRVDGILPLTKPENRNMWLEFCFFGPRRAGSNSYSGQLGTGIEEPGLTHEVKVQFEDGKARITLSEVVNESWIERHEIETVTMGDNLELAIPYEGLRLQPGDLLNFVFVLVKDDCCMERAPREGLFSVRIPAEETVAQGVPQPRKILLASSEVAPFAKTGGLADVAGSLPKALRELDNDIRIVLPRYGFITQGELSYAVPPFTVDMGGRSEEAAIFCATLGRDIPVYLIDNQKYFGRENLYGYPDDIERFIFFSKAVLEMVKRLDWQPDIIHCNDWHTAIIPNYLSTLYRDDPFFEETATVFSIHNLAYQGVCDYGALQLSGIADYGLVSPQILEHPDRIVLMGRGIVFADVVNAVSGRYALEVQTPQFGEGLDFLLRDHRDKLFGVLNGIDFEEYNPASDKLISATYDLANIQIKQVNKLELQRDCGLAIDADIPLIGIISRLTDQKGFDMMAKLIDPILSLNLELVVLGTGDPKYHDIFERVKQRYPTKAAVFLTFDNALAHRIYAGSDMFLMPSNFEPCGLGQLIALRYGTIPIVRSTGGLADTVQDYNFQTDEGNGFVFDTSGAYQRRSMDRAAALFAAIVRALEEYKNKEAWTGLVRRAMNADNSWANSAKKYEVLYQKALASKKVRLCKTKVYDLEG